MNLTQWAIKWAVPFEALHDLQQQLGVVDEQTPDTQDKRSETAVQAAIRLEASQKGLRLWRNNVGACQDSNGNFIRYGLANDSKKMNSIIKSSDLVGVRPVVIEPCHVGHTLGQFVCREVKEAGWTYSGAAREVAQLKWITLITSMGGDAAFAAKEGTL